MLDPSPVRTLALDPPGIATVIDLRERLPVPGRRFDPTVAAIGLLILAPLFAMIALAIAMSTRGPVLFRQERLGRNGTPFLCFKFRTMHLDAEARLDGLLAEHPELAAQWEADHKLETDPRVTRVGRWLRITNLDELPQLLNVARGEMALVGPRPIVAAEAVRYGADLAAVHSVLPGITGLWQVSGRNRLSYAERVRLDRHYVAHRSTLTDLGILARTPFAVGSGSGAR